VGLASASLSVPPALAMAGAEAAPPIIFGGAGILPVRGSTGWNACATNLSDYRQVE